MRLLSLSSSSESTPKLVDDENSKTVDNLSQTKTITHKKAR